MATWKAKCWLGSESGYQDLEVQSNTCQGAEQQLRRIYGAERIINLREVRSGESSPSFDLDGTVTLLGIVLLIGLIVNYWWIIVPLGVLLFAGWLWVKDD